MIDTIKFMLPLNEVLYDAIQAKSFETVRTDKYYGWQEYKRLNTYITLNRAKLSIFSYTPEHLFLEGSMPKLCYGHNIALFYPSQLPDFLAHLHPVLVKYFDIFPSYETWGIQRLDMCYAYKLDTTEQVESMLQLISTLRYPRKSIHIYPKETISYGGRSYSLKFYSKEKEFARFDGNKMIKDGLVNEANELMNLSTGVLRYEVTNRKSNLNGILKDTGRTLFTYKDILDINIYYDYLNKVLDSLFKGASRVTMSDIEVWSRLKATYNLTTAKKLFMFYKMLYSENPFSQHFIHEEHNATTVKRTIEALSKANVGIPDQNAVYDFKLTVPSERVVNAKPLPASPDAGEV